MLRCQFCAWATERGRAWATAAAEDGGGRAGEPPGRSLASVVQVRVAQGTHHLALKDTTRREPCPLLVAPDRISGAGGGPVQERKL